MGCSWKKSKHMEQNVRGRKASIWNGMFMEEKQASIWSGKSIEENQACGMGCSWMECRRMDRKGHRKGIRMGIEMCMGDECK